VYEHIEQAREKGESVQGMSVRVHASFCTHYSESGRVGMCARVLVCVHIHVKIGASFVTLKNTSCKFIPVRLDTLPSAALPTSMSCEALLGVLAMPKIWREDKRSNPNKTFFVDL